MCTHFGYPFAFVQVLNNSARHERINERVAKVLEVCGRKEVFENRHTNFENHVDLRYLVESKNKNTVMESNRYVATLLSNDIQSVPPIARSIFRFYAIKSFYLPLDMLFRAGSSLASRLLARYLSALDVTTENCSASLLRSTCSRNFSSIYLFTVSVICVVVLLQ